MPAMLLSSSIAMCGAVPIAGRAVGELAGLALGERDELLHRLGRHRRMNDQRLRQHHELRDRREHLGHVVGHRSCARRASTWSCSATGRACSRRVAHAATASMPTSVPPPGRLSTTNCWPSTVGEVLRDEPREQCRCRRPASPARRSAPAGWGSRTAPAAGASEAGQQRQGAMQTRAARACSMATSLRNAHVRAWLRCDHRYARAMFRDAG